MRHTLRQTIKQLVPPALLSLRRALLADPAFVESPDERLLRERHEQLNRDAPEGAIRLRPGCALKVHPESRFAFEAFCFRYPSMVPELDRFLELTQSKRSLLDIGALHGMFSLVFCAADAGKASVAVDASPIAFSRLLYNVHKNGLVNVTPVECALSDGPGTLSMHYEWEHAVSAGTGTGHASGLRVEKRTGDDLCESLGFAPDVVKIDVEGHEVKVWAGLRGVLARHKPIVFLEVHPRRIRDDGDTLEALASAVTGLGYTAESLAGDRLDLAALDRDTAEQRVVLRPDAAG